LEEGLEVLGAGGAIGGVAVGNRLNGVMGASIAQILLSWGGVNFAGRMGNAGEGPLLEESPVVMILTPFA
jgi:hypothetical protein